MRIFFAASMKGNTGPSNANRNLFENWAESDDVRTYIKGGKPSRLLWAIKDAFWCDAVISGGPGNINDLVSLIAAIRKIPVIGYCHGYAPFENEVNGQGLPEAKVRAFIDWLDSVDIVATNSNLQKEFLEARQPSLKGKVESTWLGIVPFAAPMQRRPCPDHFVVAVSGGTRPIKGNDVVARAVLLLKEGGLDVGLRVYGRSYIQNRELDALIAATGSYKGQMPQDKFTSELREASIFVMNSRHDSFGLSAMDALAAGCSLLLSENCGIKEVLETKACDVISNCEDAKEVSEKIAFLAKHPNGERLYQSIDFERYSWVAASNRLRDICALAIERKTDGKGN